MTIGTSHKISLFQVNCLNLQVFSGPPGHQRTWPVSPRNKQRTNVIHILCFCSKSLQFHIEISHKNTEPGSPLNILHIYQFKKYYFVIFIITYIEWNCPAICNIINASWVAPWWPLTCRKWFPTWPNMPSKIFTKNTCRWQKIVICSTYRLSLFTKYSKTV